MGIQEEVIFVPANVKASENIGKHLTKAEIQARKDAESAVMPDRAVSTKAPKSLANDAPAKAYWKSILERMDGLGILDDLDREMLAIYCSALSRRDALNALCRSLVSDMAKADGNEKKLELANKLDALMAKVQAHEKLLLSYADKMGMTPEARARLARKRAAQEAEADPDADLFGD